MPERDLVDEAYQRVLFRTAVLVMACDGEIHANEVRELKVAYERTKYFSRVDFDFEMTHVRMQLQEDKVRAFRDHFKQLAELDLSPAGGLHLLELVLRIVYADQRIHENEVKFCQLLQQVLRVPQQVIEQRFGAVSFLVERRESEKKFSLGLAMDFASTLSIPEQEDFHQLAD